MTVLHTAISPGDSSLGCAGATKGHAASPAATKMNVSLIINPSASSPRRFPGRPSIFAGVPPLEVADVICDTRAVMRVADVICDTDALKRTDQSQQCELPKSSTIPMVPRRSADRKGTAVCATSSGPFPLCDVDPFIGDRHSQLERAGPRNGRPSARGLHNKICHRPWGCRRK
jgi:hypothetical protein